MTQKDALTLLKTGRNVFVTGPAGSGKTHVINEYIKYLRAHDLAVGITASTGIAATHIGGMTIHAWSGMGIKSDMDEYEIEALAKKPGVANRVKDAQVLIIDEVSMLHHFRLDILDQICRALRGTGADKALRDKPFGGLQVVLCGDFFQLPPVSRIGEDETHFIYRSPAWRDGEFLVCYLSENHRQVNDESLSILNEIRGGNVSEKSFDLLMSRHVDSLRDKDGNLKTEDFIGTRLYTHNVDVDLVNDQELASVAAPEFTYEMTSKGKKPLVESLKRSCLAPEILRLRKGARVMCVKNNFEQGYVNGTLGVVISCGPGMDPVIHTSGTPEYPNGRRLTIERATWMIADESQRGKNLAEIQQYPLRLAWAITVHKSQGMSLDAVEVDLSKSFEPGMGYVALSRVRTLKGLTILGINDAALQVHQGVLEYDRRLRQMSREAEAVMAGATTRALENMHKEFLVRVAPVHTVNEDKEYMKSTLTKKRRTNRPFPKRRKSKFYTIE